MGMKNKLRKERIFEKPDKFIEKYVFDEDENEISIIV